MDVLGLTVDRGDRDDPGTGLLGRMLRRWMPDGAEAQGVGEPGGAARVRAWPRMDVDDDRDGLLDLARGHAARLALIRTVDRLRQ